MSFLPAISYKQLIKPTLPSISQYLLFSCIQFFFAFSLNLILSPVAFASGTCDLSCTKKVGTSNECEEKLEKDGKTKPCKCCAGKTCCLKNGKKCMMSENNEETADCCDDFFTHVSVRPNFKDRLKPPKRTCSFCPSDQVFCRIDYGPYKGTGDTSTDPTDYYPFGKSGYERLIPQPFPEFIPDVPYVGYCITAQKKYPKGPKGGTVGKHWYSNGVTSVTVGECCDKGEFNNPHPLKKGGSEPQWMYDPDAKNDPTNGKFIPYSDWKDKYYKKHNLPDPIIWTINPYCDGQAWY